MLFNVFIYLIITSTTFLTFLHIQTLKFAPHFTFPSTTSWRRLRYRSQNAANDDNHIAFLPLKDLRFSDTPMDGNTWFMSSLNDTFDDGETEHLAFPSDASNGRLLCLAGASTSNGTMNSYALAPPEALPPDSMLLPGLTFVSDTYYGYDNLYHGLSAVSPFVAWHGRKECVRPARWVLYHKGEVRMKMSSWVRKLMEAVFGRDMELEGFDGNGGGGHGPRCFENAVVFRHQEGRMVRERKEEVYEMMRCKARDYCNVDVGDDDEGVVRLTLLLRVGKRSFKDDEAVIRVFEEECKKVVGCRLMVVRPNDIPSFCDQVKLLSATDIVATPHGAQLTNMIFMDKNGSIMEFFPKGWKELAGVGQYVFRWAAIASGMRHQGAWNDPKGDRCPYDEESKCFPFYKDRQLGLDTAYFANWTAAILKETMEYKTSRRSSTSQRRCSCT